MSQNNGSKKKENEFHSCSGAWDIYICYFESLSQQLKKNKHQFTNSYDKQYCGIKQL